MAGRRVHFVLPQELLDQIDAELPEGMSRGFWVRRALEKALASRSLDSGESSVVAAPASPRAHDQHPVVKEVWLSDHPGRVAAPERFPHGHECPERGCHWSAASPNAICPKHNRKIREP